MDFLSDENLKKYKFQTNSNDESKSTDDKQQTQYGKSKSRIGFRQTKPEQAYGYPSKDELISIEQLDSLALFMRNHSLNNSENYPFYNNYDERNIGIHKSIIYQAILGGNQYNATNNGVGQEFSEVSQKIRSETFEEELNRKMKMVQKSKANIDIPNSLDVIGSTKSLKYKTQNNLDDDVEFENDLNDADLQEQEQYIQENDENYVQSLIEPFNEDDFDLARINNKIFDDYCWYKKDFRMNQINDPSLFNEKRQYYENKRIVKRQNKEHLIYFIASEIVYNKITSLMPHQDNIKALQNIIKDQLTNNQDILSGHVLNTIYKIDVERSIFRQEKLELQLENFGQIHLRNSEEIFICGGKAHGIAQNGCMLVDFTLRKYMIKNHLHFARYDHLLLQLDDFVYIIGGSGSHGETLLTCEKYNIKSQQLHEIASLELTKNFICGTVSQLNKCLYVAGSPLIVDSYLQIQKFEPYTNFWSVINIQVNYLTLKQPKLVKLALYDESIQKSQMYIFCQDMNKFENYCLSLHDLTGDNLKQDAIDKKKRLLQYQQQQQQQIPKDYNVQYLSTINSNNMGSNTNFYSSIRQRNSKSPSNNKKDILIDDQTEYLDLQVLSSGKKTNRLAKSVNQLPKVRIESPRMQPFKYVPQFNDQVKLIYQNRKQYNEQLKKKLDFEKQAMLDQLIGDTENDETIQLNENTNQPPPPIPFKGPSSFKEATSSPRMRSNSKLLVTPKNQAVHTKSIFFDEQQGQLTSSKILISTPKISGTPKHAENPYYYLTKQQQQKRIYEDYRKHQQKLFVIQQDELKKRGQVAKIEQTRSDFNNLEILATRDFEIYTINKNNPLHIEKFDFITWKKEQILLRYSTVI